MRVIVSEDALRDLRGLYLHLHSLNPVAARKILRRIEQRFATLTQFPNRGPVIEVRQGRVLRRILEPPFIIVYAHHRERLTILRVFHGARDGEALLDGLTIPDIDT
jgi:plasmid stabilization system protein ParE